MLTAWNFPRWRLHLQQEPHLIISWYHSLFLFSLTVISLFFFFFFLARRPPTPLPITTTKSLPEGRVLHHGFLLNGPHSEKRVSTRAGDPAPKNRCPPPGCSAGRAIKAPTGVLTVAHGATFTHHKVRSYSQVRCRVASGHPEMAYP